MKREHRLETRSDGVMQQIPESVWFRSEFLSVWRGPDLELVVIQKHGSESWQWTCHGWRSPDDCDSADRDRWVLAATREIAEQQAIHWYMQKDD